MGAFQVRSTRHGPERGVSGGPERGGLSGPCRPERGVFQPETGVFQVNIFRNLVIDSTWFMHSKVNEIHEIDY